MIFPVLPYNSEIWGVYVKPDFKTWDGSQIEKTHLQFCKLYLEVNKKASNNSLWSWTCSFSFKYH